MLPLSSPLERPKSRGAVSSAYSTVQREPYVGASCRRSETLVTAFAERGVRYCDVLCVFSLVFYGLSRNRSLLGRENVLSWHSA